MSKKMTPIRKTFDRAYDLFEETPPDINLPWGHSLIRFASVRSNHHRALVLMHACDSEAGDSYGARGEALCGESGRIGAEVIGLSANIDYQFCRPCQEAAASKEEA
jgi:hypothetical protein